jgi:protein TonB
MMIVVTGRPQPIQQVLPAYPEELRKQGIKGEAIFHVLIDDEGIVREVNVKKSLHPYLDNAGVQAIKQWTFEPVLRKGRPTAVSFNWTIDFDPEKWSGVESTAGSQEEASNSEPRSRDLKKILDRCAEYSQKLAGSALDFFCEETIKEINLDKYIQGSPGGGGLRFKDLGGMGDTKVFAVFGPQILQGDPHGIKISRYVCDYQMFKKGNQIEERRVIVKENGRLTTDRKKMLEEKRFSVLKPLFATVRVLARDRQPLFVFRLLKDDKVRGRVTYVIEAVAKPGGASGVQRARIWVDKMNFQILQNEIQGMPAEGYEFIFKDAARFKTDPRFIMTSTYQVEKNGVLFPGRVNVIIEYPWKASMQSKATKLETEITYDRYKFFTVETEHRIIK